MSKIDELTPLEELAELIAKAPKTSVARVMGEQIANAEKTIELAKTAVKLGMYSEIDTLIKLLHYNREVLELLAGRLTKVE